jgi:hypothetical protein
MTQTLPVPEVVRCYFDESFEPHLPAMCLRWQQEEHDGTEAVWELPEGMRVTGPPPRHFGVLIQRQALDSYFVRLLWDRTCLTWHDLTREQLLHCDLDPLLAALGTDLWYLLDQPLPDPDGEPPSAA